MRSMGAATQDELDALRKRVRDLERTVGKTASAGAKRSTAKKPTARSARTRASTPRRKPSSAS
jgi:hypothetical protein